MTHPPTPQKKDKKRNIPTVKPHEHRQVIKQKRSEKDPKMHITGGCMASVSNPALLQLCSATLNQGEQGE